MADTPASPLPPPASPMPPPSRPVCTCRAAKGKEVTVLVDSPPPLKAKASGSLRGTKWPAPVPGLAGLQDVLEDAHTEANLPEVQVEQPSSQPVSPNFTPPSPVIAIGNVSAIILSVTFMSLEHN